jgi:hypothetical protein
MNMADQHDVKNTDMLCTCPRLHKNHICVLRGKGSSSKVKLLSCTPNVVCEKCNHEANSGDSVCIPISLFI